MGEPIATLKGTLGSFCLESDLSALFGVVFWLQGFLGLCSVPASSSSDGQEGAEDLELSGFQF
jgi:hypothetical protein